MRRQYIPITLPLRPVTQGIGAALANLASSQVDHVRRRRPPLDTMAQHGRQGF